MAESECPRARRHPLEAQASPHLHKFLRSDREWAVLERLLINDFSIVCDLSCEDGGAQDVSASWMFGLGLWT